VAGNQGRSGDSGSIKVIKQKTVIDINDFFNHFFSESDSDRSIALLGGALLDDDLSKILERELNKDTHKLIAGPLRSFGVRIDIAYGLGWIDRESYLDLRSILEIRNAFAHFTDHKLTFDDAQIEESCKKIESTSAFLSEYDRLYKNGWGGATPYAIASMRKPFESPRMRYKFSIGMIHECLTEILENGADFPQKTPLIDCARNLAASLKPFSLQIS
jgi:hypothetical protein